MDYFPLFITKQDEMIAKIIRKFVDREIIPNRDKIDDDKDHVLINSIFKKLNSLGFDGGLSVLEYSKMQNSLISHVTSSIIIEELSRGDVGIGIVSAINGWGLLPAYYSGNKEIFKLYEEIVNTKSPVFTCFSMTESASGCDIENVPQFHGKTIKTTAVQDGDSWIINGAKVFASNSGISSLYCVVCRINGVNGDEGIAIIYVPDGTEGMTFGKFEMKAGLQADRNTDIYFDNVRVPRSYRASENGKDVQLLISNLTIGRVASAAAAVGCARGTFDEVLKYTGERRAGGKAVRDHSIAAGMLADMATGIETARTFYLQVAYMVSNPDKFGAIYSDKLLSYASMCKNYATDMAISVTNRAMELMGSYGYIKGFHVEKYWRDIKEIQLWLGGTQLGKFDIVRGYYPYQVTQ